MPCEGWRWDLTRVPGMGESTLRRLAGSEGRALIWHEPAGRSKEGYPLPPRTYLLIALPKPTDDPSQLPWNYRHCPVFEQLLGALWLEFTGVGALPVLEVEAAGRDFAALLGQAPIRKT